MVKFKIQGPHHSVSKNVDSLLVKIKLKHLVPSYELYLLLSDVLLEKVCFFFEMVMRNAKVN